MCGQVADAGYVEPLSTVSTGTLVEGRVSGVPAQVSWHLRPGFQKLSNEKRAPFCWLGYLSGMKFPTQLYKDYNDPL